MQRYLQRITGMFLRLPRMDSAFFHSVFCSQDAIFFHLLYSREQRAKGACLHAHLATVAGALTYGIIERKSICSHIFPADVWIYYSVPFGIAEIFKGNGCMACSPACGAAHSYADDISAMQTSETVPLFLKERQAGKIDRSEKSACDRIG